MPSHMYGVAVRMYPTGSTLLSSHLRRAANAPNWFPAIQLRMIAGMSSASVYGTAPMMMLVTDRGNSHTLMPKVPVEQCDSRSSGIAARSGG